MCSAGANSKLCKGFAPSTPSALARGSTHTNRDNMSPVGAYPLPGTRIDSDTDSNKCQKQQQEAATFSNYKAKRDLARKQGKSAGEELCPPSLRHCPAALSRGAATDCSLRAELLQVLLIELSQHHVAAVQGGGEWELHLSQGLVSSSSQLILICFPSYALPNEFDSSSSFRAGAGAGAGQWVAVRGAGQLQILRI